MFLWFVYRNAWFRDHFRLGLRLGLYYWNSVICDYFWFWTFLLFKTISVRYSDIDVGLIILCQRHWYFLIDWWRRFQFDTWISMWALYFKGTGIFLLTAEDDFRSILGYRCRPYISKALGFSYWLLKTISGRYLDIDVGLIFQRHWYFLIDWWRRFQFDTWISMWALYFKGTGIFLLTAEDDSRSILGYRCGPYISKALGFSLFWRTLYTSCVEDDFSSVLGYRCGPYISKALRFSYWLLKTISGRYLDIDVGLIFQRRWYVLIDYRRRFQVDTWISMWALYFKGTEIFLLTAEDDLQVDTCIDVGLIFQRRWDFLYWLRKTVSVLYWVSTAWPYILKILILPCW